MIYYAIFIFGVFLASISQILLKNSANKKHSKAHKEYFNRFVVSGYFLLFISLLCGIIALKQLDLKLVPMLESISYIFVLVLSAIFLKENITKNKLIGLSIILIGIIVFNL